MIGFFARVGLLVWMCFSVWVFDSLLTVLAVVVVVSELAVLVTLVVTVLTASVVAVLTAGLSAKNYEIVPLLDTSWLVLGSCT